MYLGPHGTGRHLVVCPWSDEHTTGHDGDGSTIIFDGTDGRPPGFRCQHSHCTHRTIRDVLEHFGVGPSTVRHPQRDTKLAFSFELLGKMLDEPEEEVRWLVDGLLICGGVSMMAAKPKAGKTTITSQLAMCVARGLPFLGKNTVKGKVLYLPVEEKRSEVVRRFRVQGANGDEEILIHAASAPPDALTLLEDAVREYKPQLVIVDTLFKVMRVESGNDYAEVTAAIEPFQHIARTYGPHVMLVHHMGKSDRSGADGILGSTALTGSVDTAILLDRKETGRTIKAFQRYGTDLEETTLGFDTETQQCFLAGSVKEVGLTQFRGHIRSVLYGVHNARQQR
jgi:hypothetical protein